MPTWTPARNSSRSARVMTNDMDRSPPSVMGWPLAPLLLGPTQIATVTRAAFGVGRVRAGVAADGAGGVAHRGGPVWAAGRSAAVSASGRPPSLLARGWLP